MGNLSLSVKKPQKIATVTSSGKINTTTVYTDSTVITKPIVKKALMVGINYEGTSNQLNGCINDTLNLKNFMLTNKYFVEEEITFMTDHSTMALKPTKANMLTELSNLVTFANSVENKDKMVYLFFSYSGHGSYLQDQNAEEVDGRDEVICPLDCDVNGFITDDVLKANLVNKLGSNVKLVMLMDSCFSGTVLDLKYNYKLDKRNTIVTDAKNTESVCDTVMISGCTDAQTSADAYLNNTYQGAMTASFIMNFTDKKTTKELVTGMRTWLKSSQFTQIPQLSAGRKINVDYPFLLSTYDGQ